MELIVRVGEREERVRIEQDGERYHVVVGETAHAVEAVRVAGRGGLWSLVVDGGQHDVAVWPQARGKSGGEEGRYTVSTRQGAQAASVTDPLTHLAREAAGAAGAGGAEIVAAYMPGRVVAVLAEEGEEVAAGQGIVVLEAMKMENEIAADHEGVVTRLHVEPGQAVEGGDPLFELGPIDA